MKQYQLVLLVIIVTALQVGFLPALRPYGVIPDLLAVVIVALGLMTTASQTLICAMAVGLALDLSSASSFGLHLGVYTVTALAVSLLARYGIAYDTVAWQVGLSTLVIVAAHLTILGDLALHGVALPFGYVEGHIAFGVLWGLVLMLGVLPLMRRLVVRESMIVSGGR